MDLKKKAIINSVGSLVLFAGQWLISVLIVKVSGYGDAGIFNLAMSISNVFSFIANYNIRNYQISDSKNEFTQTQYLLSRVVTTLISFIICAAYLFISDSYSSIEQWAIIFYLLYSNVNVLSDVMLGTVQLGNGLEINGYSNIIRGTACVIFFFIPYVLTKDLITALIAMIAATAAVTLIYDRRIYLKHLGKFSISLKRDMSAVIKVLKCCFLLMLSTFFPIVTTAIPRKIINDYYGEEALGYFSTIFTPTVLIITLAPALILSVIPELTEQWNKNNLKESRSLIYKSYGICLGFMVLAELAALVAGRPVMKFIYNEQILDYYNLIYWAIAATGINACTSCGNAILIIMRKNIAVVAASFASMLSAMVLSGVFIKEAFIYGASYALLIAYTIQAIIQIVIIVAAFNNRIQRKDVKQ